MHNTNTCFSARIQMKPCVSVAQEQIQSTLNRTIRELPPVIADLLQHNHLKAMSQTGMVNSSCKDEGWISSEKPCSRVALAF